MATDALLASYPERQANGWQGPATEERQALVLGPGLLEGSAKLFKAESRDSWSSQ